MAVYYVRNDGSNTAPYDTWAKAATTLATAVGAASAGETIYVADGHSESTGAGVTYTMPGTAANPLKVLCVDDTGDPEPPSSLATGAVVATGAGAYAISIDGYCYVHGITFNAGVGSSNDADIFLQSTGSAATQTYKSCVFYLATTRGGGSTITIGPASEVPMAATWIDCDVQFNSTGSYLVPRATLYWLGGSVLSGVLPDVLFKPDRRNLMFVQGLDLSYITSIVYEPTNTERDAVQFVDCQMGSGATFVSGTMSIPNNGTIEFINCDSADTNYRFHRQNYQATETHETTKVRTGGASDGTTTFSRAITTTANVTPHFPYESMWMEAWNETTGSEITVTVPIVYDSATNLQNDEVWLEVEYLGTSGYPLGSFATNRISDPIFGTPADLTADGSSTWGGSWTNENKDVLAVAVTPQEKGIIRARVCVAKASQTLYYDPLLQIS